MACFLGLDTSAYTTSAAVIDNNGNLVDEERQLLTVLPGERGLQQSQAVFQHIQNLPMIITRLFERCSDLSLGDLTGVAVSQRPRPVEGSYMPVFRVGLSLAESLSTMSRVFLKRVSHQEGHLRAGLFSAGGPTADRFLAVHFSGGTSELLKVDRLTGGFAINILGATTDLHAGQLVDRVGVRLGLPFPAGPALEALANKSQTPEESPFYLPSAVKGCNFSFSGAETKARSWIETGGSPINVARAVEACIAKTLEKVLRQAIRDTGIKDILFVGGVMANQYLRQRLKQRLEHPAIQAKLCFAAPHLSSDNAVGVALLAFDEWQQQQIA